MDVSPPVTCTVRQRVITVDQFCEGLGLTLALTAIANTTDLTVVYASTLGAQPQPDHKLRALA